MQKESRSKIALFLIGLGSATKIYLGGVISFSEIVVFAVAPFLFIKNYLDLKRNGILPILLLSFMMIIGCFISCQYNGVYYFAFIKAAMTFYSIFAFIVVFFLILRQNFTSAGWFYLGVFLSQIITIFAFNPQLATDGITTEYITQLDAETQMEGVLFWYPKIIRLLYLPIQGMFFSIPILYTLSAPIMAAIVAIGTSVSGRGAAAMALISFVLILVCRKSRNKMKMMGKRIFLLAILMMGVAYGIKSLYSFTAKAGILGDEALRKYERQTLGNDSFLRILIGGRTEFFIAIRAMLDYPIIGIGPYAVDTKGYTHEFLQKYGEHEDFVLYEQTRRRNASLGAVERVPQHSLFTQFWGFAGISGLLFSIYFIYLIYVYFRYYSCCIPQWFGWMVLAIPPSVFTLFFNPYTDRAGLPFLITCLLLARAVGKRSLSLPERMELEARKYE